MKKILFALLPVAVLFSCTERVTGSDDNTPVQITLSAGMPATGVQAKAPVESDDTFVAAVAGWVTYGSSVNYASEETWLSVTSAISGDASQQAIQLNPLRYYEPDNNYRTFMKAWYPEGVLSDGVVTFSNFDGSVDAMLAGEISGSKLDNENKVLVFNHMTTQINFVVVKDESLAAGTALESITIKDAAIPTGFDLSTDKVIYSPVTNGLSVRGIAENLIIGTNPEGDIAGEPVMIEPFKGNTMFLDVRTSAAFYENVQVIIDEDADFQPGKAYTITLTFTQEDISLKASVTEWTHGTGSGIVE
ncbi:MAG: fimbrillin family protein [Bacteroidetes bacterium]|uniref:Fimbrillin family protein n=1 Tax=Candidatus Merdivivens pullicola TaxID=2840872 RepID=A0A9D9III6_9BACT|nr:fimbrillin family protein [Candidatus Merdivivens pullicola]